MEAYCELELNLTCKHFAILIHLNASAAHLKERRLQTPPQSGDPLNLREKSQFLQHFCGGALLCIKYGVILTSLSIKFRFHPLKSLFFKSDI